METKKGDVKKYWKANKLKNYAKEKKEVESKDPFHTLNVLDTTWM